jgi:hypothetical protein
MSSARRILSRDNFLPGGADQLVCLARSPPVSPARPILSRDNFFPGQPDQLGCLSRSPPASRARPILSRDNFLPQGADQLVCLSRPPPMSPAKPILSRDNFLPGRPRSAGLPVTVTSKATRQTNLVARQLSARAAPFGWFGCHGRLLRHPPSQSCRATTFSPGRPVRLVCLVRSPPVSPARPILSRDNFLPRGSTIQLVYLADTPTTPARKRWQGR